MAAKLYKRLPDGALGFRAVWAKDGRSREYLGRAGHKGIVRSYDIPYGELIARIRKLGFAEVDADDQRRLIVEYKLPTELPEERELEKAHRLESELEKLLWLYGLGDCDGCSVGSGRMEVCCFVVDFAIAKATIERELANTELAGWSRIYDEDTESG